MHVQHVSGAGATVQVVYVLCDDPKFIIGQSILESSEREVCRVWFHLRIEQCPASEIIKLMYKISDSRETLVASPLPQHDTLPRDRLNREK